MVSAPQRANVIPVDAECDRSAGFAPLEAGSGQAVRSGFSAGAPARSPPPVEGLPAVPRQRVGRKGREDEFSLRVAALSDCCEVSVGAPGCHGSAVAANWLCQTQNASFTSGPLRQNKQTNKAPTATGDEKKHLPFSMVGAYLVPSPCSAKGLEKMTQFLRD